MHKTAEALTAKPWEAVFLAARQKRPGRFGGGSLSKGESWQTSRDAEKVDKHLQTANIGYLTGPKTELAVIDVDKMELFQGLVSLLGAPAKRWVRTGSGKEHLYLTWERGLPAKLRFGSEIIGEIQRGSENENGSGLQQVVAPGSIHPGTGDPYTWLVDPVTEPLRPLPDLWRAYLHGRFESPGGDNRQPDIEQVRARARQQPGARERSVGTKFQCAACRDEGHDKHEDNAILFNDGRWGCAIGGRAHWDAIGRELGAITVTRKDVGNSNGETTAPSEDELALEFTRRYRDELQYVDEWGRWPRWDGARWRADRTREVFDLARKVCRDAALLATKGYEIKRLRSAQTVAAVVRLACADRAHARVTEDYDQDLMLLNTPGGTVDLRTGQIRDHRPEDAITKCTTVTPGGDCALWLESLRQWTNGNQEAQRFLQRLIGYTLTGQTREHVFGFLYGTGANGKGTLLNLLIWMLGEYAAVAPMEAFIESKHERHPTELAMLRGARLVVAQETVQDRRWDETKLKAVTGGDPITARFMRQDFFTYIPQFKLLISGNHKPGLRSNDEAMRRRLLLLPFNVVIRPERRDPRLPERLRTEAPGILAWAIEGCLEWQRIGLHPSKDVVIATEEYFTEQDAIGRWLKERCVIESRTCAAKRDLYASWEQWAKENLEFVLNKRQLLAQLRERLPKLEETKLGKANIEAFKGIGLRAKEDAR